MANDIKNSISEAVNELNSVKKKLSDGTVTADDKFTTNELHSALVEQLANNIRVIKEEEDEVETIDSVETDDSETDITTEPLDDVETDTTDDMGGEDTPADDTEGFDAPEEEMPLDDLPLDGEPETVDLTGASDEEVLSVFKKMNPDDEIEVKMDSEGNVELKDGEEEYLISIDGEEETTDDVVIPEPEAGFDVTPPEVDVETGVDSGEEIEDTPEMDIDIEDTETDSAETEPGSEVIDDIEDDLESLNEDSEKREMDRVKEMGKKDKGHEQESKTPSEVEPGKDSDGDKPKETIIKNPKEVDPGRDATGDKPKETIIDTPKEVSPGEEVVGKLSESLKKTRKRLATTISENISLKEANERLKLELSEKTSSVKKLSEQVEGFTKLVGQHTKVAKNLKGKLNEMTVFTQTLSNAVRILSEQTLTKDEKRTILERFDSVQTLEECEKVYNNIISDLSHKRGANPDELISNTINESVQRSGSKQINQSTVHSNMDTYKQNFYRLVNR